MSGIMEIMTEEEANTLANSIDSIAKGNAMFYAAEAASLMHPGKVDQVHLKMLDMLRMQARTVLVDLLKRIKV